MIDVVVNGAAGKMGREVVKALTAAEDIRVVAAVDSGDEGLRIDDGAGGEVVCSLDLATAIARAHPDVMVDFTHPATVRASCATALSAGVHCVVGTTGLSAEVLEELVATAPPQTCLFVAPNFAIGAVLMMRFAQEAARFLPHAEIVELHHDLKADAPSGTALRTAELIAAARQGVSTTPGRETELYQGARGAVAQGIHVHSVRLPGLVAHQEVILGAPGQTLTIRHDTIDRTSFMPGVVLAVRSVVSRSGLIVGLESLMEA